MISFIICSMSPERVEKLSRNIEKTIGDTPYEIIAFDNRETKYGITKVYNLCAEKARYECLCFVHEDVIFRSRNWGESIVAQLGTPRCGCIGFAGSKVKSKLLSSVHSIKPYFVSNYIQSGFKKGCKIYENNIMEDTDFEPCVTLDGLCIFVRKDVWEEIHFDEEIVTGFHGYDLDFSIRVALQYRNYICNTLILEHTSIGSFSTDWVNSTIALHEHQAWKDKLPIYSPDIDPGSFTEAQENDIFFYFFIRYAIRARYPFKNVYRFIKEYWNRTHFKEHSMTLLLKIIKIYILHLKY